MSHTSAIQFQVPIIWFQRTIYENFHDIGWSDINHMETSKKKGTLYSQLQIVWYDETTFMGIWVLTPKLQAERIDWLLKESTTIDGAEHA